MSLETSRRDGVWVTACGRSHRGQIREENQDNLLVLDLTTAQATAAVATEQLEGSLVLAPIAFELGRGGAVLLVADGMGGRKGGASASAMAIASVREAMCRASAEHAAWDPKLFAKCLRAALHAANGAIHAAASKRDGPRGMGSTATLVGLLEDRVYVAQVGDSRAYLVRNRRIGRLTRDQSLVQNMIDAGLLSEDDAKSVRSSVVLQALGTAPDVVPTLTEHTLRRGDALVLCSDGLSQVVTDEEILAALASGRSAGACEDLVSLANARGGPDNVTVVVAVVEGSGIAQAVTSDDVRPRAHDPE